MKADTNADTNDLVSKSILTLQDYERLFPFLQMRSNGVRSIELLAEKLAEAELVPQTQVPPDIMTMNSVAEFIDEESGSSRTIALVYPNDSEPADGKISILSPIGIGILGIRVGQTIEWPTPKGRLRRLNVSRMLFQPEAVGAWDL